MCMCGHFLRKITGDGIRELQPAVGGKDADGDNAAIESRLPMPEEVIEFFKEVPPAG